MSGQENFWANPAVRASCMKYVSAMIASNAGLLGSSNGVSVSVFSCSVSKSMFVPLIPSNDSVVAVFLLHAPLKNSGVIFSVKTSLLIIRLRFGCGRVALTVTNVTL
uniref:Uncharacterized protein n=1 Tax=Cacopsylla melanoneura TaxID=428564 RepID=A0A8D8ZTM4_9HEMI